MNDVRELELPDISPHILRHTACTRYAEAGIDIKTIQYLMGHGDIKATMKIYNHTDLGRAQRELKKYEKMQAAYCKPNADSTPKLTPKRRRKI